MNKENEIIKLLLEKADQFVWKERQIESGIGKLFTTSIGGKTVTVEQYDSKVYVGSVYIGQSSDLEDTIVKILSAAKQRERDSILDPVLNFLQGAIR